MDELKLDIVYYFRAPRDRDFNSTIIPKGCLYAELLLGASSSTREKLTGAARFSRNPKEWKPFTISRTSIHTAPC